MERIFEWDPAKAENNYRKHGVSFELAIRAFDDPLAMVARDRSVEGELRWHLLGMVEGLLLLLVVHTVREEYDGSEVIRIISARRPTKREREHYEND